MRIRYLVFGALGAVLLTTDLASAQANCAMASTPQMRAWCYQQQSRIYREQSQAHHAIARRQYQMHRKVGRAFRVFPKIGPPAARAWNAPRYYYNYRYGRP